jgi:putative ABC transport system permease protein
LAASPSYLQTMRIPLLDGRWFTAADTAKSRPVYVVDHDFAKRYFPGQSAVGQRMTFGGPPKQGEEWPEIIGVVGNVRENGIDETSGNPYLYYPTSQAPTFAFSIFLRTTRSVADISHDLQQAVSSIDPSVPVFGVSEMESVINHSLNDRRSTLYLLAGFACLALLLSGIGIYGVLAYDVSQRLREIGIRGALGASPPQIRRLVLKQSVWKAILGLAIGLLGALLLSHFLASLLYDVKPTTPSVYTTVSVILLAVAALASYLPARRAARVDPAIALQSE